MGSEATIEKLQIEIDSTAKGAYENLDKLKKILGKIKKASENSGLSAVKKDLQHISQINFNNMKPLSRVLDSINTKSKRTMTELRKIREEVDKLQAASLPQVDTPNAPVVDTPSSSSSAPLADTTVTQGKIEALNSSADKLDQKMKNINMKKANSDADKLDTKMKKLKSRSLSLGQLFKQVVMFGGAFRLFSMAMTGLSEGLQNIARYSDETSGNMDKLSTMSLKLKNSIGASLYPVIVALTPALQTVTNVLVGALDIFNMFISALQGKDTYIKATTYLDSYADKTESTAAKIKRSLAGFDEINIIGDNSSKAASSSTPDYSAMFEKNTISEELQNTLNNISILGGAALIGIGAVLTFSGVNIPLGLGMLSTGLALTYKAATVKWDSMKGDVEGAIKEIGGLLAGGLLIGVGAALAFSGVATGVGLGLIAGGLTVTAESSLNWDAIPEKVRNVIGAVVEILAGASFLAGFFICASGNFPLGLALMAGGAAAFYGVQQSGVNTQDGHNTIDEFGTNLVTKVKEIGGNIISGLFEGISNALSNIGTWINEHIVTPFVTWFKDLFGIHSPSTVMAELGGYLIDGLVNGCKDIWGKVSEHFDNLLTNLKTWFTNKKTEVKEKWQEFTSGIKDKTAELKGKFTQKKKDITEKWNSIVSGVKDKTKEVKAKFSQKKKDITEKWNSITSGVKNKTKELKGKFTQKKKDLTEKWADITEGIKNKSASVSLLLANGKTAVTNLWESVKTWWGEKTLSFKLAISDIQSGIKGFINTKLITPVNNVLQKIDKDWKIPLLYKDGGIVPYGQMFIAREAGPEMVGTIGNQTAVANNSQIVEGIASGVYEANSEQNMLLREEISLLRQILNKDSSFEITAASVARSFYRKNMRDGRTTVPVGV